MQLSNRSQWAKEDFKSGMFGYKNDYNNKNITKFSDYICLLGFRTKANRKKNFWVVIM